MALRMAGGRRQGGTPSDVARAARVGRRAAARAIGRADHGTERLGQHKDTVLLSADWQSACLSCTRTCMDNSRLMARQHRTLLQLPEQPGRRAGQRCTARTGRGGSAPRPGVKIAGVGRGQGVYEHIVILLCQGIHQGLPHLGRAHAAATAAAHVPHAPGPYAQFSPSMHPHCPDTASTPVPAQNQLASTTGSAGTAPESQQQASLHAAHSCAAPSEEGASTVGGATNRAAGSSMPAGPTLPSPP